MMTSNTDFLIKNMLENWKHAHKAEDKRMIIATSNFMLVSIVHVIISFIGLNHRTLFLNFWMMIAGIYGIFSSLKLYERQQYHIQRARSLRGQLDKIYPEAQVELLQKKAEEEHRGRFGPLMKVRLNVLWIGLHITITCIGLYYTLTVFLKKDTKS